ncbi:MAG: hypothetical protein WC645_00430 [Candidatus Margulisiibacteriota bacterium]
MKDTRQLLGEHGITYTITVGLVLRRLPTENFLALKRLLKAIAERKGPFRLIGMPSLIQIVGIPKNESKNIKEIPGIDWDKFNVEADPHGCPDDILGIFIRSYYDADHTLNLSRIGRFEESQRKIIDVQRTLNLT